MRTIKRIHKAQYNPIDDLITYSPLPSRSLNHLDPFLFLNHHGPQDYPPENNGLPFGPHPHRGMETVTFIIDGDIAHKDSSGHESVITAGGVQWMTAGSGLIHCENSSREFLEHGGKMEILQLWINLPAKLKMTNPKYTGLQKEQIPEIKINGESGNLNLISGIWDGTRGAFETLTDIFLCSVYAGSNAKIELPAPRNHTVFFYVVRGNIKIENTSMEALHLLEFKNDGESVSFETETDCIILFGHAKPFNEPIVAYGPFVMNTDEEIDQAYNDYRQGKFGSWVD